jgi:rRNA-processing protein EBP2
MSKLSTSKKMGKRKPPQGTSKAEVKAKIDPTEEASGSTSEEDDDGVTEAGMERLMKALGNDGLDDVAQHMLQSLNEEGGDDDEVSSDDQDEDEENEKQPKVHTQAEADTGDGDSDEVEEEQEKAKNTLKTRTQQEEEVDLDELSSVDEDVIPRQKVVIDNKASVSS